MTALLPSRAYVIQFDSAGNPVNCGSLSVTSDTELSALGVLLYKHGPHTGTPSLRVLIYPNSNYDTPLYTGSYVPITDIPNLTAGSWWGWFRFPVSPRLNLKAGTAYYVRVQANYTPAADESFYLAISLDWPLSQNSGNQDAAAFQVYGYREI